MAAGPGAHDAAGRGRRSKMVGGRMAAIARQRGEACPARPSTRSAAMSAAPRAACVRNDRRIAIRPAACSAQRPASRSWPAASASCIALSVAANSFPYPLESGSSPCTLPPGLVPKRIYPTQTSDATRCSCPAGRTIDNGMRRADRIDRALDDRDIAGRSVRARIPIAVDMGCLRIDLDLAEHLAPPKRTSAIFARELCDDQVSQFVRRHAV